MKSGSFIILLLTIISSCAFSQTMLKGKLMDAGTGKPLSGATITYGNQGTMTGSDGMFSINCGETSSVAASFIGYSTQEKAIKNCNTEIFIYLATTKGTLEQVEITATSNQNKSILYQPASIGKLTPVELKRGMGLFLDDAIQANVPGVTMNRRSVSGGQQFNIRGYGNGSRGTRGISSNFDGQGYKVYLNGIPVTDAEGITTLDDIDMGSIGNVEVVKGPAGTLYGLAIAGAVNLSTIAPEKGKTSVGQEVMIGNYGLRRFTSTFQTATEYSSLLVNYGHQDYDGSSIHNKSKKDFASIVASFHAGEKQLINTYVGYSNSYDERFGELTIDQYNNNDYSGNIEYIKRNAHSGVITFRAGVGHTYQFNSAISNSTTVFGTGFTSNASSAGGWTDKNSINYGLRSVFNTKFKAGRSIILAGITGIELQRQDAQTLGYNMKQDPSDTGSAWKYGTSPYWIINATTSNFATISKTMSLFTEWTLGLPGDFSLTAGVGSSNMGIALNDRFNVAMAARPSKFDTTYKAMVSPHFAINKVFNKHMSLYASYSKGYKAPVSSYFYITTPVITNPPTPPTGNVNGVLKPETGNQYELGSKGQLLNADLMYEIAYFYAEFSNKMTSISVASPASPNTTLYSYMVNGGKQIHRGIEALVRYNINSEGFINVIRPFANITYSDFKYGSNFTIQKSVVQTEDYSGKDVAGVAKVMANIGIDVMTKPGLYANITYNYKDPMPITSLNDLYAAGFNLVNAKIGFQKNIATHFDLDAYFGAGNIFNSKYYQMVFVNQLPDAYIPAPVNATLFGGINLKYNF
ncbi:TonB-dependent receptor [Flavitalea sp.]|nr:TonB-dependent receptor [Flavitalea sp.]